MKKFGLLAGLALCVTIGGVYAGWYYAEKTTPTAYGVATVGLTGVDSNTEKGTLKAAGTNVGLKVDDINDGKLHNTVLTYNEDGYFTITFTPSTLVKDADVLANGIDVQWYVGLATTSNSPVADISTVTFDYDLDGNGTIEDGEKQQIYASIDKTPVDITEAPTRTENQDGTITFTWTVDMDDIMDKIDLAEIYLNSEAMHNAYSAVINQYVIHFHAAEKAN